MILVVWCLLEIFSPFHISFVLPSFIIYSPTPLHIKRHKPHAHICVFVHLEYLELYCRPLFGWGFFFDWLFFFIQLCIISKFHLLCAYFFSTFELLVHKPNTIGSCTDPVITRDTRKPQLPQNCVYCSFSIFLKNKGAYFCRLQSFH